MVQDTEVPKAPLEWAESIHGDLVLVDRVQADGWEQIERGSTDEHESSVLDGVLATTSRGAGLSLKLATPEGPAFSAVASDESGRVDVVTVLGGEGTGEVLDAARALGDDVFESTEVELEIGFVGLVLFDGSASWEMASESMLYVYGTTPKGTYRVSVAREAEAAGQRVRVIRLTLKS